MFLYRSFSMDLWIGIIADFHLIDNFNRWLSIFWILCFSLFSLCNFSLCFFSVLSLCDFSLHFFVQKNFDGKPYRLEVLTEIVIRLQKKDGHSPSLQSSLRDSHDDLYGAESGIIPKGQSVPTFHSQHSDQLPPQKVCDRLLHSVILWFVTFHFWFKILVLFRESFYSANLTLYYMLCDGDQESWSQVMYSFLSKNEFKKFFIFWYSITSHCLIMALLLTFCCNFGFMVFIVMTDSIATERNVNGTYS